MKYGILNYLISLILAPLLFGIINKTKAKFAGRKGQPIIQIYFDIFKLLKKGAVYSETTTWIFKFAPIISLSGILLSLAIIPLIGYKSLLHFSGDLFLLIYLLAMTVFMTVLAALDTGSSFEGMGGSREVLFSMLIEPAFIVGICVFARTTGSFSLSEILPNIVIAKPVLILVIFSLFIVFLVENSRIPIDDPETHLELTMIHEVMVLDYSGPDFAFILYSSSLKMWLIGMIIMQMVIPLNFNSYFYNLLISICGMGVLAVIVGIVESTMARLRLTSVPRLLIVANALSILAFILVEN